MEDKTIQAVLDFRNSSRTFVIRSTTWFTTFPILPKVLHGAFLPLTNTSSSNNHNNNHNKIHSRLNQHRPHRHAPFDNFQLYESRRRIWSIPTTANVVFVWKKTNWEEEYFQGISNHKSTSCRPGHKGK